MIEGIISVQAHRFQSARFLNGEFSLSKKGDPAYHLFFFPRENAGFFNLKGNWTDIVLNRIIFISPNVDFSVKCEETSLDCFHVSFNSSAAYTGPPCYFTVAPPELRLTFTEMNIALGIACLMDRRVEALEHLSLILELLDALVSESRITYAARHAGRLMQDIPRHFHDSEYQIEYFVEGMGSVYYESRWMEYSRGCICFIPPGITHELLYPKSSELDNYSIKFKLSGDTPLAIPASAFVTEVSDERQPVVLGLLKKIVGDYVQDIPISPERLKSLVTIINEINSGASTQGGGEHDIITQIKQIVNANISRELRITDIAYQLDLSHEYISRQFRKYTGQTLASYINAQRLKSSLVMLKNTSMPFKQIAAECGFKNVNYFHTMFKKYFSLTPRDIREQGNTETPI